MIFWKPLSKISTGTLRDYSQSSTPLTQGMLWNYVTQLDASKISQNMYPTGDNTVGVESDLVNSYAWDTAIVYTQKCGTDSKYSRQTGLSTTSSEPSKTGEAILVEGVGANKKDVCFQRRHLLQLLRQ